MAKNRTVHRCTECGAAAPQWTGRCGTCGEWNTLVEERDDVRSGLAGAPLAPAERAVPIGDVDSSEWSARPTGLSELDRVLGGGVVPGSVTLVGGEPGIGKSTLLLQTLASMAARGGRCLLVSAEESKQQVRLRAERLDALHPDLWIVGETVLPSVLAALEEVKPDVVVIDSIQTVFDPDLGSAPGSVTQVRECAHALVREAKARGIATFLVGHVTKEGSIAGPRVLEHVVDTVLSFEGDRHDGLRLLRAVKHRFGATGELGLFEMSEAGLIGVPDASGRLLADRQVGLTGSIVTAAIEGQRPLLVEVQALVTSKTGVGYVQRDAQGLDKGRVELLVAVLGARNVRNLSEHHVHASAVGGIRIAEPAADLAVALALVSARDDRAISPNLIACGEVGLGGEVRSVGHLGRRLAEAARLGFTQALVPRSAPDGPPGIEVIRVADVREAAARIALPASK